MDWNYSREEDRRNTATPGKVRCVIVAAEQAVSKTSGKNMIVLTTQPSGSNAKVKDWLVEGPYFNRRVTKVFDAFPEIGEGNFNLVEWVGCEGAANYQPDDSGYLKVKWYMTPSEAKDLPPFEGEKPERQTVTKLDATEDDDELPDLPF